MTRLTTRVSLFVLAGLLALATFDTSSARARKTGRSSAEAGFWNGLVPVENGVPIIIKGYRPPKASAKARPAEPGDQERSRNNQRTARIPRGSSTYIPPPVPSPYSPNSPPASALTQPPVQPYNPPPITTFSDRVNSAIHAYPLERGIGNNPIDQQQFIRQRLTQ